MVDLGLDVDDNSDSEVQCGICWRFDRVDSWRPDVEKGLVCL